MTFAYPSRSEPVLKDIDLVISKGARVGVVGKTGSGKSTLVDMLMGLLEPSGGTISIDGVPLLGEARTAWQRQIAHVPQSIFLADTTIERNIAFGLPEEEIDPARVIEAAWQARIHDFIVGLPEGYGASVGERGVRLSGGQRQRLGIARALYKGTPVLIFDEATSALDSRTEADVIAAVNALGRDITVIMIAHRLTTILSCDLLVELERGRIARAGPNVEFDEAESLL